MAPTSVLSSWVCEWPQALPLTRQVEQSFQQHLDNWKDSHPRKRKPTWNSAHTGHSAGPRAGHYRWPCRGDTHRWSQDQQRHQEAIFESERVRVGCNLGNVAHAQEHSCVLSSRTALPALSFPMAQSYFSVFFSLLMGCREPGPRPLHRLVGAKGKQATHPHCSRGAGPSGTAALPTTHLPTWAPRPPGLSTSHASTCHELQGPAWPAVTTEPKTCYGLRHSCFRNQKAAQGLPGDSEPRPGFQQLSTLLRYAKVNSQVLLMAALANGNCTPPTNPSDKASWAHSRGQLVNETLSPPL